MRKTYLDNIRWITVAIVVIYHVFFMYNSLVTAGTVGPFSEVQYQDIFEYLVYPWFMLLLFVVSGMSSRFYLESHSDREFRKSRTTKLLVPSTIGLFAFQWTVGYFNTLMAGAFEQMAEAPGFVKFIVAIASGIGPLWYIQMLWLFSIVLTWIRKFEKDRFYNLCGKANVIVLLALTFLIFGAAQILNMPYIVVYRFGIYGVGFFIGYFVMPHDEVVERLEKYWHVLSVGAIGLAIAFTVVFFGQPYPDHSVLDTLLCNVFAWIAVLAIIAFMKRFGNFENGFSRFMKREAWGLYIFHYLPIAALAYYLDKASLGMPVFMYYLLVGAAAFIGAFVLNAAISRIPFFRWAVLGIKKYPKESYDDLKIHNENTSLH